MSDLLTMFVPGRPRPKGSKRLARGRMIESSKAVHGWQQTIELTAIAMRSSNRKWPHFGPVAVKADFLLRGRLDIRPDLDKLCRALLDGLVAAGIIADDGQVISLVAEKVLAIETEGVYVAVEERQS